MHGSVICIIYYLNSDTILIRKKKSSSSSHFEIYTKKNLTMVHFDMVT